MAIKLDKVNLELIESYGEGAYPHECCGFLLGKQNDAGKEVLATLPALNAREEAASHHRFLITPEDFLRGEKFARGQNMDMIGFYHSHPDAGAEPSEYDREHAWPWYSYVIVAVLNEKAQDVTSWILDDDRSKFTQERILLKR